MLPFQMKKTRPTLFSLIRLLCKQKCVACPFVDDKTNRAKGVNGLNGLAHL